MALFKADTDPSLNIPNKSSSFGYWLQWYKELEDAIDVESANQLFAEAWELRQPDSWTSQIDFANRKELIDYLNKRGLKLDQNSLDKVTGFGLGIIDQIGSYFKITKGITVGIMIFLGIILLAIGISIIKNPNAAIGAASKGAKYL